MQVNFSFSTLGRQKTLILLHPSFTYENLLKVIHFTFQKTSKLQKTLIGGLNKEGTLEQIPVMKFYKECLC